MRPVRLCPETGNLAEQLDEPTHRCPVATTELSTHASTLRYETVQRCQVTIREVTAYLLPQQVRLRAEPSDL
jgi:hypothetical protein